jgi:hypothetical protein
MLRHLIALAQRSRDNEMENSPELLRPIYIVKLVPLSNMSRLTLATQPVVYW